MLHTIWTRLKTQEGKKHIPYYISIDGVLISEDFTDTLGKKRKGRIYTSTKDKKGYLRVCLNRKTYITPSLARNVAISFIPNSENKPEVNHIDGNKENNSVENLEWCTTKENIHHAIRTGLRLAIDPSLPSKGGIAARDKHRAKKMELK